jgi:hypothetical protein
LKKSGVVTRSAATEARPPCTEIVRQISDMMRAVCPEACGYDEGVEASYHKVKRSEEDNRTQKFALLLRYDRGTSWVGRVG